MPVKKFIRIPDVPLVSAIQFTGDNTIEVIEFMDGVDKTYAMIDGRSPLLTIDLDRDAIPVHIGDWIVNLGGGVFRPFTETQLSVLFTEAPNDE